MGCNAQHHAALIGQFLDEYFQEKLGRGFVIQAEVGHTKFVVKVRIFEVFEGYQSRF